MCSSRVSSRRLVIALGSALIAFALAGMGRGAAPRFYRDDPIETDDDRAFDASGAKPMGEGSNAYDFTEHTFIRPGDRTAVAAANVNTIGEVPHSTWFTHRIDRRTMSNDEIARGPNQLESVNIDGWPIVRGKSAGVTAGYRVTDPSGHLYQIKFDPRGSPEMESGAEVVGAAIYHALGYNVVQGYIVEVDPAKIVIDPKATTVDLTGNRRRMTRDDVDRVLQRAARQPNGKYRALASRYADGKYLGHFKYYGTRPDDPNDISPHEHRRELRGNRVFAAWLNHDDTRGINSLDFLEEAGGKGYIRHFMFDFGSIMGSGTNGPQVPRAGNEYILEWKPAFLTAATFGFYLRPWIMVRYPKIARSVGRFEADFFDPVRWKPEYPNPAFDNLQHEDAFWAARLVARFSDEAIRAVVAKAKYSEPGAADYITATLIRRRDKVLTTWLTGVNPIVNPKVNADGTLTFENAAVAAHVATPPTSYDLIWSKFDNAIGASVGDPVEMRATASPAQAPAALLGGAEFVSVTIRSLHPDYPHWATPVVVYFRRSPAGWQTVGLERTSVQDTGRRPGPSTPGRKAPTTPR